MEVKYATDTTETMKPFCRGKSQVFVSCAVLEGIFLCISKAIYFMSTAESMRGGWLMTYVFFMKERLKKMVLHPDIASKKHHQIVL